MKTMIFDFNIVPSIITVKDYIVPFMVENAMSNCNTLVENNLPFSVAANAMLLHLLFQKKTQLAAKFRKYLCTLKDNNVNIINSCIIKNVCRIIYVHAVQSETVDTSARQCARV